jgi:hypothetical protein
VDELEAQITEQKKTVERLNAQIKSLGEAKQEHENALLRKFSELLNSKKLKIRDQQRFLATAKVDPEARESLNVFAERKNTDRRVTVERVEGTRTKTKKPRAAEPSRASKRKAAARAPDTSEDESSDGFEDVPKEDEEMITPDQTDDETADEDGGEPVREPTPPPPPKRGLKKAIGGKGKSTAATVDKAAPKESGMPLRGKKKEDDVDIDDIPPLRELPFGKRKAAQAASQKIAEEAPKSKTVPQTEDDDDTDDEL